MSIALIDAPSSMASAQESEHLTLPHQDDAYWLQHFLAEFDAIRAFEIWCDAFLPTAIRKTDLSVRNCLNQQIAAIDERLNELLNRILHHEKFQQLEAAWRGLWYLLEAAEVEASIKIKCLDVSWKDLSRDFERAADFDQSGLFHLIYSQEFGAPGGEPYSVLLGNYEVSHRPSKTHPFDDINTLKDISQTAAAAFAPFVCGTAPQLFGLDDFDTLGQPINLEAVFRQAEYARWHSLRSMEDSRFVSICLPRTLMREPYNTKLDAYQGIRFHEDTDTGDNNAFLWGNSCFALGVVLIREFAEVGWFSHIRGAPRDFNGGGLVTQFPALKFKPDSYIGRQQMFTSVLISDHLERDLAEQGFIPLCHSYDTPYAAFNSCSSIQKPLEHNSEAANANARISAMLQHILCASRIAQYIKVMARDKVGSYVSAKDCERLLQHWLDQYTTGREDLTWEMMARYPLRQARVIVNEDPEKPGSYQSVIHLKCHYTVDHLVSELKLTTSINSMGTD